MASLYKRGKTFWISYSENGIRKQRSLKTDNPRVAKHLLKQLEVDLERGISVTPSKTLLKDIIEDYLRHRKAELQGMSVASYQNDVSRLRMVFGQISPSLLSKVTSKSRQSKPLEVKYLEDITPDMIRNYLADRSLLDALAPASINADREIIHRLFQFAIDGGNYRPVNPAIPNPVEKVKRAKLRERTIRYLDGDEIIEQLNALEDSKQIQTMVAVFIFAGLRREEAVWLTPGDVDLKEGVLRIRSKTIDGRSWATKTRKNRIVPISLMLRDYLTCYRPPKGSIWYFPSPQGVWLDPRNFSRYLREVNGKAGLIWNCLDYRHTFGSQLAQKGVSLLKIAKLMGNTYQVAEKHYAELVPEKIDVDFNMNVTNRKVPDNIIRLKCSG